MSSIVPIQSIPTGLINRFSNGGFLYCPEGTQTVADGATAFSNYTVLAQSGTVQTSQLIAPADGIGAAIRITQSSGTAQRIGLAQTVLASNCQDLRNLPLTATHSAAYSPLGRTMFALLQWNGTADAAPADPINNWTSTNYAPGGFFVSSVYVLNYGYLSATPGDWRAAPIIPYQGGSGLNNLTYVVWTEDAVAQTGTLDLSLWQVIKGNQPMQFEHRPSLFDQISIPIDVASGGTGDTSLTDHGVLIGSGTDPVTVTAVGATGTVLKGNTGADPSFGAVSLTADVTGILPVANGGTGASDASGARTNLGLANVAYTDQANVFTANQSIQKASATLTVDASSGNSFIVVDREAGSIGGLSGRTANSERWRVNFPTNTAESGANAGSNFVIQGFDDAGALLGSAMQITRSSLKTTFGVGGVAITPTAATTTQALDIDQTGPTTGSSGSIVYYNQISINSDAANVSNTAYGLGVLYTCGGSNLQGQRTALVGRLAFNATSSASNPYKIYAGLSGEISASDDDGGTNTSSGALGSFIGSYASAILASGATNILRNDGLEVNTGIRSGASARWHRGMAVVQWADHAVSGAEIDCGMTFVNQDGAIGWKDELIRFDSSQSGSGTLLQSTGYFIRSYGSESITGGIDISSFSYSGNAFASPGFAVNGAGTGVSMATGTAIPAGGTAGVGYKFSSTSNFGVFFGSGAPSLSAAKGSLYLRSDGSTTNNRMYVNTDGSTAWTAVTTAS